MNKDTKKIDAAPESINTIEEAKKLKRLYSVLSEINHAIVRIHDEQELFDTICGIAVNNGGFLLAWIGLVDKDTNKLIIKASAGKTGGYIKEINVDLNDLSVNNGPSIKTLRTGLFTINNEIDTSNNSTFMMIEAEKIGIRSSLAFPIRVFGEVIGIFKLYSDEHNYFDDLEIKMIEEAAMDLSFALEYIKKDLKLNETVVKLRESESLLEESQRIGKLGSWVVNLLDKTIDWSEEMYNIFGVSKNKFSNKTEKFIDLIYPEDRLNMTKWIRQAESNLKPKELIFRVLLQDNTIRYIRGNGELQMDSSGRPIRLTGTAQDITEQVKKDEVLKTTEQQYSKLVDNAQIGIYTSKLNGEILYANDAFCKMLEYDSFEELTLHNSFELYKSKESRDKLIDDIKRYSKIVNYELEIVAKSGKLLNIIISSYLTGDTITGLVLNVSELKKAEMEIKLKNEEIENYFNSAINLFCIADTNGFFRRLNKEWEKVLGYKIQELEGRRFLDFVHPDDVQSTIEAFTDLINNKSVNDFVNRYKAKNGLYRTIEWRSIPSGRNIYASARDVTEQKIMQNELILSKELAEKSNKLKDAFIANISHEIRTPLNGILGMTKLIENSLSKYIGKDEKEYFIAINQASTRIVKTIDMILNYSRIQIGEFPVNNIKINLPYNIESIMKMYKTAADNKSIKLTFENKCGEVEVIGDLYCFTQSVSNLIDNAVKYTNSGSVKLILFKDSNKKIKLDIQDTGIGISEEYLSMIYEPYSQEEIGYSRGYEGIGLGLSLVKKYLFLIGAEISVKSEKEKGSTFTISFGKVSPEDLKNSPEDIIVNKTSDNNVRSLSGRGKTLVNNKMPHILIVEDDAINQLYMRNILKYNYTIIVAFSADSALKKIQTNKFDLILMDISLKGEMNGLDLIKILKNTIEHKNIPVIAVTGFAFDEDRKNCFKAGCDDFLAKPFSENELLTIVAKCSIKKG